MIAQVTNKSRMVFCMVTSSTFVFTVHSYRQHSCFSYPLLFGALLFPHLFSLLTSPGSFAGKLQLYFHSCLTQHAYLLKTILLPSPSQWGLIRPDSFCWSYCMFSFNSLVLRYINSFWLASFLSNQVSYLNNMFPFLLFKVNYFTGKLSIVSSICCG